MVRPLLFLERLSHDVNRAEIGYRYGEEARELEWMD
jgi:hypothetical protein